MLANLLSQITVYETRYHRASSSVSLIAVSKNQSSDKIRALYQAGQHAFGESYLQEALVKMEALSDCDIEWHFIGPIQSNKTKKIAERFSWVQSVASEKIAKRLNDQRPVSLSNLNICIEVNLDNEVTKSGVSTDSFFELLDYCQTLTQLRVRGIMAIPPKASSFELQCQYFNAMKQLWEKARHHLGAAAHSFDTLSMGMSSDFHAAIKEGSTMVRIGKALFIK